MKRTAAVFARELAEKVFLAPAALLAGILPFALSLRSSDAMPIWTAEDRFLAAAWIAAAMALVLSAILGSSVLAREMSEGRLRFFFSRPIGATAIWFGKLAAAAVAVWLSALLVMTPATLAGGLPQSVSLRWALTLLLVLPVLLLSHGISLSLRSRSLLALAVLGGLAIAGMAAWLVFRDVQRWTPLLDVRVPAAALAAFAVVIALGIAGRISVTRGRGDLRTGFAAFSRALLVGVAALVLAAKVVSVLYSSVPPSALSDVRLAEGAPAGDFVFVGGLAPSRPGAIPAFLFDTRTGRSVRVRMSAWYWEPPAFSADGTRAAWLEASFPWKDGVWTEERPRAFDLVFADLGVQNPKRSGFGLPPADRHDGLLLSPDGRRVAIVSHRFDGPGRIGVYALDGARLLAVFDRPAGRSLLAARFADSRRVTLIESADTASPSAASVEVVDLEVDDRTSQVRTRIELPKEIVYVKHWSVDLRRALFIVRSDRKSTLLVNLESGRLLKDLGSLEASALLFDGRIAIARALGPASQIELLSPDGELFQNYPTEYKIDGIGPSPSTSEIYLSTSGGPADSALLRLNLESGSVRNLARLLWPIARGGWQLDRSENPRPGAPVTRLFLDYGRRLIRLDPETGAQTVLLGRQRSQSGRPTQ